MRLYMLELKRILKTRATWIILGALLILSAVFAYLPATFVYYTGVGPGGEKIEYRGVEAVRLRREAQALYAGQITEQKLQSVLNTYQSVTQEYGDYYSEDFPAKVYHDQILPITPLLHILKEAYADPETGMAADLTTLTQEDIAAFYPQLKQHVSDLMKLEQKEYPAIQQKAARLYERVEVPLEFYPGYNLDSQDYITLYLLVLMLGMVLLFAPVFSADYQTGADDILRITKHGRAGLALAKLASALTILLITFLLCSAILYGVSSALFGRECFDTSAQIAYSAATLESMTLGDMQIKLLLAGLATIFATTSCTLYLSTKCSTSAAAIICAIGVCLLPTLIYYVLLGNAADWLRCLLPSGGLGLSNSYQYELIGVSFLRLGGQGFRPTTVMLCAALIEAPLFLALGVRSYCKHKA